MKNMSRSLLALMLAALVLVTGLLPAFAEDIPYDTYNYDYWNDIFRTPAAYVPQATVPGTDLTWNGESLGGFLEPQDIVVAPDGNVYVADTNNHRIVVLDNDLNTVVNVIAGFDNAGLSDQFNKPTGVCVTEDGWLYIADSANKRIVVLDGSGALQKIVEIPKLASTQSFGGLTYTISTFVEGMEPLARTAAAPDGTLYAVAALPVGSASTATDENGLTYTVVAVADGLQPLQTTAKGEAAEYAVAEGGKGVVRMLGEEVTTFTKYDPVPNKDIFLLIGNLVKWMQGTPAAMTNLQGIQGVWAEEDGSFYAISDKSATRLNARGKLEQVYGSYKDETGASVTFVAITEFCALEDEVYIRDGANKIIVMDQRGDLVKIIASNAVEVKDADGNVVAVLETYGENTPFQDITGVELLGGLLFVGQADGTVVILTTEGETLQVVENDSVVALAADGAIADVLTTAVNGKVTERFTGVTGVAMLGEKLCVSGADNRVIVLNEDGTASHIAQNNCVAVADKNGTTLITGYDNGEEYITFSAVNGVRGLALNYYCDANARPANQRVKRQLCVTDDQDNMIIFNAELAVTRVTRNADSEVLAADFDFTPKKVAVDYAGRIYCVVQNKVQGIMVFETNGDFTGFFGTIEVSISAWDKFWRKLATKEERSKQQLFIPTEFTGIDIDQEGFVYATNVDENGVQAVRRLNPKGEDVIRMGMNANLGGDIQINGTSQYAGPSKIVDVVYRDKGIYSLLDSKRGRIFTYDHEGNLLYIFGGLGSQTGTLGLPVAIEYTDERILVLDARQNSILIFGETEYGRLINDAVALRFDGDEALAVPLWEEVLRLDENNELANTGIGKAYLSAGDNATAMKYLKRGMNQEYYSVAFKRYRNELLKDNIQYVLTGGVALAVGLWAYFKVIKPRVDKKRERRA
ncbi:MAG: hypothetical protein IKK57_09155 [Clostridia bacterium]|nr:hypothetical protein [Clostridia bacterium]